MARRIPCHGLSSGSDNDKNGNISTRPPQLLAHRAVKAWMKCFKPNAMLVPATFRTLFHYSELLLVVLAEPNALCAIPQEIIRARALHPWSPPLGQ
jgi:hypothetical protein